MNKTPYYIIDLQKLKNNLSGLREAFENEWPNFVVGYSFKTNNLPWIASWMRTQGVLAEIVSTPEYELAKYVGYRDDQIILNGPCKGYDTLDTILKAGGIVNLDSFQEIDYIKEHLDQFANGIKVGIRINFDLERECPGETIPGNEPGRFGFNIENGDFKKAIEKLSNVPNVKVVGIHGHHSTRTKSLAIFKAITTQSCECAKYIPNLEYIDLGGCLFGDKPGAPTFEEYARIIVDVLNLYQISKSIKLILEPGAALIASPVSYVCKVLGTKDIKGTRLLYTDGSIKHIAPQMNTIKFTSSTNTTSDCIIKRQVVTGYSCVEMDRFLELENQRELKSGDEITIFNIGAYTMSLAPLFIEYFPSVYVKDGDKITEVREAWTTKEFVQKNHMSI